MQSEKEKNPVDNEVNRVNDEDEDEEDEEEEEADEEEDADGDGEGDGNSEPDPDEDGDGDEQQETRKTSGDETLIQLEIKDCLQRIAIKEMQLNKLDTMKVKLITYCFIIVSKYIRPTAVKKVSMAW